MSGDITVVSLSDAEIKRQAKGAISTMRDDRYPGVMFRFLKDRSKGSWFLYDGGYKKIASYPHLSCKKLAEILPDLHAQIVLGRPLSVITNRGKTCGELLSWYRERAFKDRSRTAKRKNDERSIIDVHLMPRLSELSVEYVARETLDEMLMWPIQEVLSTSYARSVLRVLQMVFAQAKRLDLIGVNPMAGLKFTDFVQAQIMPKPASLHMLDLPWLMERLTECFDERPETGMLALMMLCHGTRIGETRRARWRHICLAQRVWIIPAENTKTRKAHTLPLTEQVCALLSVYRERMKGRHADSDALFVGRGTGKIVTEAAAFSEFRWMSGGAWSSHDLRKLARTGWVEIGVDYLIGEMLLNHSMGFSAETYINTSAENLKLDALSRWHSRLDEFGFVGIHSPSNTEPKTHTEPL